MAFGLRRVRGKRNQFIRETRVFGRGQSEVRIRFDYINENRTCVASKIFCVSGMNFARNRKATDRSGCEREHGNTIEHWSRYLVAGNIKLDIAARRPN